MASTQGRPASRPAPAPDRHDALLACSSGVVVLLRIVPGSSKYQVARADSYVPGTKYVCVIERRVCLVYFYLRPGTFEYGILWSG